MLGLTLYAGTLLGLSVLTLRKPHIALVAVLCMFGLDQIGEIYHPFFRENSAFTNVSILSLVIVGVIIAFKNGRIPVGFAFQHVKVRILSIALFAFALLSLTWTPVSGWIYWASAWPYLIASIVLAPLLISRVSDLHEVQRTFISVGGVIVLFLAIVPDWGYRSLLIADTGERLGLPLALGQMSGYLLITAAIHYQRNMLRIGWLALVVVAALVVAIQSGSRGPVIFSIFTAIIVMPMVWTRFSAKHAVQLVAAGGILVMVTYFVFGQTDAYTERWQASELMEDSTERIEMAKALLTHWVASPASIMFGLGNSASFSPDVLGIYPHIVPLEVLGELGVVGFALLIAVIFMSVRQSRQFVSMRSLSVEVRQAYAAVFGCFIFTLLLSLKQGSLLGSPELFLFAILGEKYLYLTKRGIHRARKIRNRAAAPEAMILRTSP